MVKFYSVDKIISVIKLNLNRQKPIKLIVSADARKRIKDLLINKTYSMKRKELYVAALKNAALDCNSKNVEKVTITTVLHPTDIENNPDIKLNYDPWLKVYIKNGNAIWLLNDPQRVCRD